VEKGSFGDGGNETTCLPRGRRRGEGEGEKEIRRDEMRREEKQVA